MTITLVLAIVEAAYHSDLIIKDTVNAAKVVIHATKHPKKMVKHPKLATREALHK